MPRGDWRPPTIEDRQRLNALLRDVAIHLRSDTEMFEQAEQDLRAIGGDSWSIGIGRHPARAERCRELATWVEDELVALKGGYSVRFRSTTAACSLAGWLIGSKSCWSFPLVRDDRHS